MKDLANALRDRTRLEEAEAEGLRWAAVALILRGDTVRDAELLFIRRAEREGDPWSGHVAFPGGRRDVTDASLETTASRETLEELDVDLTAHATLLGVLDDLRPRSPVLPSIAVRPFVYRLERDVVPVPNHEVHSVFWVPVATLRDPAHRGAHVFERGGATLSFPAYLCGDDVVWGMTEKITTQLLSVAPAV